jgi:hypothetical protein
VRLLVGKGADMDIAADNGAIPLYIKSGHLDVVQPPVQNWADLNKADYYGAALLFSACKSGHLNVVQLRVQNWADLNKADKYGLWRRPALQRMQERPPERRAAASTELGRPERGGQRWLDPARCGPPDAPYHDSHIPRADWGHAATE